MKTKIISKILGNIPLYEILESDELGLIPLKAGYARVIYDENNKPESVFFGSKSKHPGLDIGDDLSKGETRKYERMCRRYDRQNRRATKGMNRERTLEQIRKIAIRLESSVVN
ncbi:MAG: hypothetical protein Q7S06_02185 [Nanoarchaeota archaeon]|nr:hypothetical protein [Nanoarchaeota archaeon]